MAVHFYGRRMKCIWSHHVIYYGNSASVIYMDALPTVLIESLLGYLHAAALARAQQVNHSFWALARAVAAFIVQQRNVAHMLRHSETHVQLLRRLELRPSIMVRVDMDRLLHR